MDSYIAEWDVPLTDKEILFLRNGGSPFVVREMRMTSYRKCEDGFFRNSHKGEDSQVIYLAPCHKEKTER